MGSKKLITVSTQNILAGHTGVGNKEFKIGKGKFLLALVVETDHTPNGNAEGISLWVSRGKETSSPVGEKGGVYGYDKTIMTISTNGGAVHNSRWILKLFNAETLDYSVWCGLYNFLGDAGGFRLHLVYSDEPVDLILTI